MKKIKLQDNISQILLKTIIVILIYLGKCIQNFSVRVIWANFHFLPIWNTLSFIITHKWACIIVIIKAQKVLYFKIQVTNGKEGKIWDKIWLCYSLTLSCLMILVPNSGFPGGLLVKNLPANAGDVGSIPGSGRSPGGGNGRPLQYSCLWNPMDRGAWRATWGHKESDTTEQLSMHTIYNTLWPLAREITVPYNSIS